MSDAHVSAADHLGPHLLGRNPMPADDRDYRLEDFIGAHQRMAANFRAGMTVEELATEHDLMKWHDVYAFWAWFKANVLGGQHPTPTPTPTPSGPVEWLLKSISDQGQTGKCVGFTGRDWGVETPVVDDWPNDMGSTIYYMCVPGDVGKPAGQEQGSDSRTLCKALKKLGRLGAYAFTGSAETAAEFVLAHGPIGTGIPWDNDMFNPDGNYQLHPGGGEAGGHEITLNGFSEDGYPGIKEPAFKMPNHWSTSWGDKGYAYITLKDWQSLLDRQGDSWAGLELPIK